MLCCSMLFVKKFLMELLMQVRNNKERLREMEKQLQMSENNLRLACQHNAFFLEKIDVCRPLSSKDLLLLL
jgi:hypothetical protein